MFSLNTSLSSFLKDCLKKILWVQFRFRDCFIPRYIGPNMDMVKLHSMDDMLSLPVTSWNIHQPSGEYCLVIALLKMVLPFATAFIVCTSMEG